MGQAGRGLLDDGADRDLDEFEVRPALAARWRAATTWQWVFHPEAAHCAVPRKPSAVLPRLGGARPTARSGITLDGSTENRVYRIEGTDEGPRFV